MQQNKLKSLPLLPTGKSHISFSEFKDHIDCSFRHNIKQVKGIDMFEENVHTNFGTGIHDAGEHYLKTKELKYEIALDSILKAWEKYDLPDMGQYMTEANAILEAIPGFLDEQFPGWECFDAEERMMEPIESHEGISFKGYIDAIIKHGEKFIIADWKTSGKGWNDWKKKDQKLKMQLIFYAHFWSIKHNIPIEKIEVGFIILNRDLTNPERIEYYTFPLTKRMIEKTLERLDDSISMIKNRKYFKEWKHKEPRRMGNCRFCDYNETKYCP